MASFSSLVKKLKDKLGWDRWNDWHPISQTLVKLFPLLLIVFAIPLTIGLLQQQQNTKQEAANPDQLEAESGVLSGNVTVVTDTTASGGQAVMFSQVNPTQSSSPTPTSSTKKVVNVSSIPALKTALADNSVDEIVVANGTYAAAGPSGQGSNALWIGSQYASRTRPVLIRAETPGGVTFDLGGANGGISFTGGAHHQTWDGFHFANALINSSGVIVFGGYPGLAAPHDIALKRFTIDASCHRTTDAAHTNDHSVYFSYALDNWGNILIEDLTVEATASLGLSSGIHMDHGYPESFPLVTAHGVTVRRLVFHGNSTISGQQAIILWQPPIHDWLFDGATITNAGGNAIRFESIGASNIVFKDITSTASHGFYSSMGTNPPGVSFINDNLK